MINKLVTDLAEATAAVQSGDSVAIGGFGRAGIPGHLIDALCDRGIEDLHVISNNAGKDHAGIARLVRERRVRKLTCTFPGHAEFFRQYLEGDIELELVPQGTLAERLRAGGSGIPAFYTPTSVGTMLADGTFPSLYAEGTPAMFHSPKETREIDGRLHVLEFALVPDVALVKAHQADRYGNLRFRLSARNFNPLCAMAGRVTIAEVEEADETTVLAPDDIHVPGAFVTTVIRCDRELAAALTHRGDVA